MTETRGHRCPACAVPEHDVCPLTPLTLITCSCCQDTAARQAD